ncbi:group II intron reverse transcriptase/maturase [Desulfonatronum thioautotrophicum]|uniref:group II intron reverse transcriptase/maturase n=1 Tax=Desulfonatronum thioautotrophicum TaxID=617001 RepID=UPI000699B716|nr:group II intron reverse transcriptase/maturase [Desulfonatronum thioautotrophicum]
MSETIPPVHTAKQGMEAGSPQGWTWVEKSVWTDRMLAALGNGVKGGKWFSLIDKVCAVSSLKAAWQRVEANKGAAGVDNVSIECFEAKSSKYLEELSLALKEGTYKPQPVRRTYIPRGDGKKRPLGIPTVKDRVAQGALKMVLEPIFEHEFHPNSFGFRPGRGCKDALREVVRLLKAGHTHVVDADLSSYFDTIAHDTLMGRVQEKVSDGRVLGLVQSFLSQGIMEEMKQWTPEAGTPQGAVISPLLANIYLHDLDMLVNGAGYSMIRYADDFVILCRSAQEAQDALALVKNWVDANGLALHPVKTRTGDSSKPGEGFDFLGFRFEAGKIHVRKSSMKKLRDKIRKKTRRTSGESLEMLIKSLNPMLRGWFEYFKHAGIPTFAIVDGFVRRRLRSILRKYKGQSRGTGRCLNDHKRWPNAFFAKHGLFTMKEARVLASQSR